VDNHLSRRDAAQAALSSGAWTVAVEPPKSNGGNAADHGAAEQRSERPADDGRAKNGGASAANGQAAASPWRDGQVKPSDLVIAFIERLRTPSGKNANKPLKLRRWQKALIRDVYDRVDGRGIRIVRNVLWTMAKKNGKSALIAALVLVHLCGPEAVAEAEIVSAANSKDQAALIFKACEQMIKFDALSPNPLGLAEKLKVIRSKKRIVCHSFGSFYQSLSADGDTAEGISPTMWIYDELGRTKKLALYESLVNADAAWQEPLGFIISVNARAPGMLMAQLVKFARALIAGKKVDPTWSVAVFEVPEDVDPFDERYWHLANPGIVEEVDDETGEVLPAFKSVESIRRAMQRAQERPSEMAAFLNFQLNREVDDMVSHIHLAEDWKACAHAVDEEALRGAECFGGLDLSRRFDLSALALIFPKSACKHCGRELKRVVLRCWTPDHRLADREQRDEAPYTEWRDAGYLTAVPGKSVDYRFVAREIMRLRDVFDLREIGFDPWRFPELEEAMKDVGLDYWVTDRDTSDPAALQLTPFIQGAKTFNPAIEQMEQDVLDHVLAHGDNPVLNYAAVNAVATTDENMNRRLAKKKARGRIDPYVALTMAQGIALRYATPEPDEIETGLLIV
jgi:phage terminase large subunit-like protein